MKGVELEELRESPATYAGADDRPPADAAAHARLWAQISRKVARETGARAWFRSRPTPERTIWALSAALPAIVVGCWKLDAEWLTHAGAGPWVWFVAFNLLVGICLAPLLRPLGKAPSSGVNFAALALAAALPALYVLLEGIDSGSTVGVALGPGVSCFLLGSALSLPFVLMVLALDRRDRPSTFSIALTSVAAGLLANGALALHCADRTSSHLLTSHASIGWALALLGVVAVKVINSRAARPATPRVR